MRSVTFNCRQPAGCIVGYGSLPHIYTKIIDQIYKNTCVGRSRLCSSHIRYIYCSTGHIAISISPQRNVALQRIGRKNPIFIRIISQCMNVITNLPGSSHIVDCWCAVVKIIGVYNYTIISTVTARSKSISRNRTGRNNINISSIGTILPFSI